jgi:hypothetical protein
MRRDYGVAVFVPCGLLYNAFTEDTGSGLARSLDNFVGRIPAGILALLRNSLLFRARQRRLTFVLGVGRLGHPTLRRGPVHTLALLSFAIPGSDRHGMDIHFQPQYRLG